MDARTRLLYWLLSATRGGPTRRRILITLHRSPSNLRQLALSVDMDYKTVQGHVQLLLKNSILDTQGDRYGAVYFIADDWGSDPQLKQILQEGD